MPVQANVIKDASVRPLKDNILVTDMHFGERVARSGLILIDDDARERGIRPRWARVYAVGPEQQDVSVGQWVLVDHGRWTRSIKFEVDGETKELRAVDPKDVLGSQNEEPDDEYVADSIVAKF